jgi:hypothetical protein
VPPRHSGSPHGNYPGGGSAFLEVQFYPPGFAPFADALSCDNSHWCAALTIDSLECQAGFGVCNNNCVEPINFAFIQTNGVPTGPPSPQKGTLNTVTPNQGTLLMNPGDKLNIHIFDNKKAGALETQVRDLSTGKTGGAAHAGARQVLPLLDAGQGRRHLCLGVRADDERQHVRRGQAARHVHHGPGPRRARKQDHAQPALLTR